MHASRSTTSRLQLVCLCQPLFQVWLHNTRPSIHMDSSNCARLSAALLCGHNKTPLSNTDTSCFENTLKTVLRPLVASTQISNTMLMPLMIMILLDSSRASALCAGGWRDNVKHGQGTMHYSSGNSYTGEWEADQKQGQGCMQWAHGEQYTGQWAQCFQHGLGCHVWPQPASLANGVANHAFFLMHNRSETLS